MLESDGKGTDSKVEKCCYDSVRVCGLPRCKYCAVLLPEKGVTELEMNQQVTPAIDEGMALLLHEK